MTGAEIYKMVLENLAFLKSEVFWVAIGVIATVGIYWHSRRKPHKYLELVDISILSQSRNKIKIVFLFDNFSAQDIKIKMMLCVLRNEQKLTKNTQEGSFLNQEEQAIRANGRKMMIFINDTLTKDTKFIIKNKNIKYIGLHIFTDAGCFDFFLNKKQLKKFKEGLKHFKK